MMRRLAVGVVIGGISILIHSHVAHAESLEIHPTIFQDIQLVKGEHKKAYIDVVNPTATDEAVSLKAQAFKQTDDTGALSFYDDERITQGVKLDLTNIELGPHEAARIYFLLDGTALPSGDVFAAIFAQTTPASEAAAQSVQVGTLLTITNGTPSSHVANVTSLSAGILEIGDAVTASFKLANPANGKEATGFFPAVTAQMQPYTSRQVQGPLLFAGRTRTVSYRQAGNYFGIVRLQIDAGGQKASRFIMVVTGFWRWLAPLILLIAVGGSMMLRRLDIVPVRRKKR